MHNEYIEFLLEILKVIILAGIGALVWRTIGSLVNYKVLQKAMRVTLILWAMLFVSIIADLMDYSGFEGPVLSGLTQILLEDGLFLVSIVGLAVTLDRFLPTLKVFEKTVDILRRYEGELIARERNEIRLHEELNALHEINIAPEEQMLPTVLERVAHTLDVSRVSIWFFSEEQDSLVCEDLYDTHTKEHHSGERKLREDYPNYFDAITSSRILRVIDVSKDIRTVEFNRQDNSEPGVKSLCNIALDVTGFITGIICVESVEEIRNWSHEEVSFIRAAGDFMLLDYARETILESNKALERAKAEFQAIADYTYSWEMWTDSSGAVLWVNSAVQRITGYSPEECLAMPGFPVCLADGEEEKKRFSGYMRSATRGIIADAMQTVIRNRDGEKLYIELSWQPLKTTDVLAGGARISIRDISERKEAEELLWEEENKRREALSRLQTFLESTPTAIVQVGADFKIVDWNLSAERIFGWSKDEVIGKTPEFIVPDYQNSEIYMWMTGDDVSTDYKTFINDNLRKDGTTIICEWHNTIIRDETGKLVSMFSIGQDITEQVMSRSRLEAERQKFEDFSHTASDFFWEINADGLIVYASERLFDYIDIPPEKLFRLRLQDQPIFYQNGNKDEILTAIDARLPFRELSLNGYKNTSQDPLNLSLSAAPVYADDGTYLGYRGTGRNTQGEMLQKTVERLIYMNVQGKVGEDYFGALVKNLVDVLPIDWAFIAEIDYADEQKARVISGFGPEGEIVPFSYSLAQSASAITFDEGYCLYADNVAELFPHDDMLKKLDARGLAGIRLNDMHGHMIGLLLLLSSTKIQDPDVIRHALNVFYPRAAAELYRKWSDRERDILQSQFLHSQRMETMGKLAGGIAHDFNNVLTPILGYAEILVDDLEGDTTSHNDAAAILRGAKRARELVEQILNFSRRADVVHASVFDAVQIVRNTLDFVSVTLPANIQIKLSVSDEIITVMGSASKFDQMIINLITNAWHAIGEEEGQIDISVKSMDLTPIMLAARPQLQTGHVVEISISDNGCGISSDTLGRIFEPFFTTKGSGKGTGFGLSTVKGIVESMGGIIEASSQLGEGTTFTVMVPRSETMDMPSAAAGTLSVSAFAMASRLKSGNLSLLYVDDEQENAKMASRMLEKLGYRVTTYDAPETALTAFRDDPTSFDIMITDDSMPVMTGAMLSAEVLKLNPHLTVIVVSGGSGTLAQERYAPLGISNFVSKPFDAHEIDMAIKAAVDTTISNIMARM